MTDKITRYKNGVLANIGQSDVEEFYEKLKKAEATVRAVAQEALKHNRKLIVYYGFHGDDDGEFAEEFDAEEIERSKEIGTEFDNVEMVLIESAEKLAEYERGFAADIERGYVFFTWCDSDAYMKKRFAAQLGPALD